MRTVHPYIRGVRQRKAGEMIKVDSGFVMQEGEEEWVLARGALEGGGAGGGDLGLGGFVRVSPLMNNAAVTNSGCRWGADSIEAGNNADLPPARKGVSLSGGKG